MWKVLALTALVVCTAASEAAAQSVQRPSRPYRGLFGGGPPADPNRSRSELTFSGSVLAGYDTWLSPGESSGPLNPTDEGQSGRAVTGDAALRYFRGRALRSIAVDGRVQANTYSGIDADSTLGGTVVASAETPLGRLTQLRVSQDFAYEPTLVLGGAGTSGIEVDAPVVPMADVTSGYLAQRSWASNSFVTLDRRWTARQTTVVGAAYSRSTYLDELGHDTGTRLANASHSWQASRNSSIRALYNYTDSDLDAGEGLVTPMTNQDIDVSFSYSRRLSPTRALQFNAGGGVTHVSTLSALDRSALSYWTPSGSGSMSWDVGRSWFLAAEYSRGVSVLEGVSVTSFATDSARASINGLVNARIEASLSTTYSNGRSGGTDSLGRFENYNGSLQLRYAISRCCATAVNYDYYVYHFKDVADLQSGFAPDFDRQAIRVGLTIWLPLYGTYQGGGSTRGSRRN